MKGKWIFRHHASHGYRRTDKEMFFGVTNIAHPEGSLFLIDDGTWSSDWKKGFASSHDRGPSSLRAFKKYLRKHPELEVIGNVMSLCSRYINPDKSDCNIDAIYVPLEKQGFPEYDKSVKAFVRMNDHRYKYLDLCFFKDSIPNNYNYTDSKFNVLGEVISWEYSE